MRRSEYFLNEMHSFSAEESGVSMWLFPGHTRMTYQWKGISFHSLIQLLSNSRNFLKEVCTVYKSHWQCSCGCDGWLLQCSSFTEGDEVSAAPVAAAGRLMIQC